MRNHNTLHTLTTRVILSGPALCTSAAKLRWDELTCVRVSGGNESESRWGLWRRHSPWDILLPNLKPIVLKRKYWSIVGRGRTNSLRFIPEKTWKAYLRENLKNCPLVAEYLKTCNNVDRQRDILFMETKSFLIVQEERSTKSPDVLWSVYCKPNKKTVWFNKPKESSLA